MPSNTEHGRNRTLLASALRLLFGPVAVLVLFHTEPVSALSPVVESIAAASESAPLDAGVATEAALPLCDLADASPAVAAGARSAATADAAALDAAAPDQAALDEAGSIAGQPGIVAGTAQGAPEKAPTDLAPADRAAPMCDSNAMSIVAPVEIPEIDRGHFEPLPCDSQALLALLRAPPREGGIRPVTAREWPPRAPLPSPSLNDGSDGAAALSAPLCWPERSAPSTLASPVQGGLAWQAGHRSRIDRPPSLRARASRAPTTPA